MAIIEKLKSTKHFSYYCSGQRAAIPNKLGCTKKKRDLICQLHKVLHRWFYIFISFIRQLGLHCGSFWMAAFLGSSDKHLDWEEPEGCIPKPSRIFSQQLQIPVYSSESCRCQHWTKSHTLAVQEILFVVTLGSGKWAWAKINLASRKRCIMYKEILFGKSGKWVICAVVKSCLQILDS